MLIRPATALQFALAVSFAFAFSSCTTKRGEAVVLEKEHIDAAEPQPSVTPDKSSDSAKKEEPEVREMTDEEMAASDALMKKVRGTSKDPRAIKEEQWRLEVRMISSGRRLTIQTDRVHYENLKQGDRIKVRYTEGNYTGTAWSADIDD
jgi:hypothetical protein